MSHSNSPNHPKIKPILVQNFASGKNTNEKILRKSSIYSIKESKITINHHLKKPFLKTLRSQNQLSKLDYAIDPYINTKPFQLNSFFSNLKHLTSIHTLNLNLIKSNQYDISPCLKVLMKSLPSLKNLTNLHILFDLNMDDPTKFQDLLHYLHKITTLTTLSLTFDNYPGLDIAHLNVLFSAISKLSNLQALSLKFTNPPAEINQTYKSLASMLLKLPLLAKIEISFRGFFELSPLIEASSIKALFTSFNSLKALSDLTLHNILQHLYQDDLLADSFALLDHSRIRKLRIHFDEKCSGEFLAGLSQILKKFNSLSTLRLKFSEFCDLLNEDVAELGSAIAGMTSLSYLSVTLPMKCKPEEILENITLALGSFENLKYLKLHFGKQTETMENDKITPLFSTIGNLKSLKSLAVDFEDSKFLTDDHLETLAKSISNLSLLKNIWVEFTRAHLVTNQGVKAVVNAIETLKNLSGMKLGFAQNVQIDDEVMEKIQEALQNLPCLYAVRLDFLRCKQITRCNGLFKVLKDMKNIGEIELSLPRTKVAFEEVDDLRNKKVVKKVFWM